MNEKPAQLGLALATRRVSKDIRDDWFSDPILFKDFLNKDKAKQYFSIPEAYFGQSAEQFNLPKAGFMLRYSLETFIYDRLLYQALIDKLIEEYDPLFHHRVYSHRLRLGKQVLIFQHGVDAWRRFIQDISSDLQGGKGVLLVTDIQNYFECISLSLLESALKKLKPTGDKRIDVYIKNLMILLREWSPNKTHGIPQNQDASSFLGNVYLSLIDKKMISMNYNYFRYMDDIRIVCKNEFLARKALKNLIINLRKIGLNVNPKKTKILYPGNSKEFFEFMPPPNRDIEEIDTLWKQRKVASTRLALPKLRSYTHQLISEGRTGEREFRFCINRLEQVARCKVLDFDFSGIVDPAIDLFINHPASSDSIVRLLRVVDLTDAQINRIKKFALDKNKNIYEWQGYLVWQLLTMLGKQTRSDNKKFRELAKRTLNKSWAPPMKAGAILYLGACGRDQDKVDVLKELPKVKSRLVIRSTVIASQELPENQLKKYLYPNVSSVYVDSLNSIRDPNFNGNYLEPLPDLNPRELFDNLPSETSV